MNNFIYYFMVDFWWIIIYGVDFKFILNNVFWLSKSCEKQAIIPDTQYYCFGVTICNID